MKNSRLIASSILLVFLSAFTTLAVAKNTDHDGEIIAYMEALNTHEIDASKLAKSKDVNADVTQFADLMIDNHGQNLQQVTDLSQKINVPADETPAVKKFKDQGQKDLDKLSKLSNPQFQKDYIAAMIKGHSKAEGMISKFEKEAKNPELKTYLADTEKVVQQHLQKAKHLK